MFNLIYRMISKDKLLKHVELAIRYEKNHNYNLAFEQWFLYVQKSKKPKFEHLIKAGEIATKLNNLGEAEHFFDLASQQFTTRVEGFEGKANTYKLQKKYKEALKLTEFISYTFPEKYSVLLLEANLLYQMSLIEESAHAYNEIILKYPDKPNSYMSLIEHHLKFKQFHEALTFTNLLIKNCPKKIQGYIYKIKIQRNLNKNKQAFETCNLLVSKHPKTHHGYLELAELSLHLGNINDALLNFKKAYEIDPSVFRVVKLYSKTLFSLNNSQEAIKLLNYHIFDLKEKKYLPLLVKMLAKENLAEKLIQLISKHAGFFNNNLNSLYEAGFVLKTNGHFNFAIQVFDRVISEFDKTFSNNIVIFKAYIQLIMINNIFKNRGLFINSDILDDVKISSNFLKNTATKSLLNSLLSNQGIVENKLSVSLDQKYSDTLNSYLLTINNIKKQFSQSLLEIEFCPEEATSLCDIIIERFKNKTPTSIIRLGDGEGNFLPYSHELLANQEQDQIEIQLRWWGEKKIQSNEAKGFFSKFQDVIRNADILGVPPIQRMNKSLGIQGQTLNSHHRGLLSIFHNLKNNEESLKANLVTSCHLHTDLESWGLYRYLFNSINEVSIIACHKNLPQTLLKMFGLTTTQFIQIPPENFHKNKFENQVDNLTHYPEIYENITNSLEIEKGEFFLVAAGFLGKFYCDLIKQKGGLALDVGSVVDLWENHKTRKSHKFSTPLKTIWFDYDSLKYGGNTLTQVKPFMSNAYCDKNIFYRLKKKPPTQKEICKSVLATGHPRCGSGFVSELLNQLNLDIGHETLTKNGISSWLFAVKDFNLPSWNNKKLNNFQNNNNTHISFDHVIHFIRNPLDAIPSIILENTNEKSFNYRRSHIYNQLKVDISKYDRMLEQAIASYIYWNQIIKSSYNADVYKIEDGLDGLIELLIKKKLIDSEKVTLNIQLNTNINSTKVKRNNSKPSVGIKDYAHVDRGLLEELNKFCEQHGYQSL